MSNKIFLIIKREYLTKVRKKSFIIMTLLGPFLFVGVFAVIALLADINKSEKRIAVYDQSGLLTEDLESDSETVFNKINVSSLDEAITVLNQQNYTALVQVPNLEDNSLENVAKNIMIYSEDGIPLPLENKIAKQFEKRFRQLKLIELGTSVETVNQANISVIINQLDSAGAEKDSLSTKIQMGLAVLGGFLIYLFIFIYGVQVMRSVIEEKTNRIVEIIISSVRPFQLMMGKIIGSAGVGLTQFSLWAILSVILFSVFGSYFGIDNSAVQHAGAVESLSNVNSIPSNDLNNLFRALSSVNFAYILGAFLFYFLGGYLLYSALFAAIGSAVDTETDTQQFMLPITLPLIIAIYSGLIIIENPNGPVAFWMSMIPLTSPVVMMARIPFDVPLWQLLLSASLLILGFILTGLFAAKIYKTGVLMYGKKATYKELWKWLKY